ncbi:LysM peptidoglycan-binding domain-containing protein [Actibacterium sp. 188UL27-1]|uniref:LysM peptidoglycan-binding domain-containing protein n=1 Tax=Actibacterium sp. 188UL27-1 TaxID=2786961 RepID=UPI001956297C|nr:LysM peptidoglycan-binding domain-containing protein [Actibacterium sp. 188UL27-1]MBM7066881.1 LysM peptidoglycan-binding domain-containing protein [Actibacterium sp. 188UL27-1]
MAEKKTDRKWLVPAVSLVAVFAAAGGGVLYNMRPDLFEAAVTIKDDTQDLAAVADRAEIPADPAVVDDTGTPDVIEAEPDLPAPTFDVVRVDAGGSALIAGTAPPRFDVAIEIDGAEVTRTSSDGNGSFAAVFDVAPRDVAQVVVLVAYGAPGQEVRSDDSVILAPQLEPAGVAGAGNLATDMPDSAPVPVLPDASVVTDPDTPSTAVEPIPNQDVAVVSPSADAPQIPTSPPDNSSNADDVPAETAEEAGADAPRDAPRDGPSEITGDLPADIVADSQGDLANDTADQPLQTARSDGDIQPPAQVERPEQAPAILLAGNDGVRVLQPAGDPTEIPPSVASVVLDSIAYSDSGAVLLTGRGPQEGDAEEILRIYLNNRQILDAPVGDDGSFKIELPDVEIGVYTLRLDRLDSDGQVTSRFETPFKREDPETLARFTDTIEALEGPERLAATVVTVQPGVTLWSIASQRYGDGFSYLKVFEANKNQIRNPDLIYPGQVFDLPD